MGDSVVRKLLAFPSYCHTGLVVFLLGISAWRYLVRRCSQNTYVGQDGSSAGDHRSLMFRSFNPHLLSFLLSHNQRLPLSPSSDQLFHRSPIASSCAPHVLEQTSSWGANETHAPQFHRAYCGFPASLPALCHQVWVLCLFSLMGSLQTLLPLSSGFHQKDYLASHGPYNYVRPKRRFHDLPGEPEEPCCVWQAENIDVLARPCIVDGSLAGAAGRLFVSCLHNSATSANFFSTASCRHLQQPWDKAILLPDRMCWRLSLTVLQRGWSNWWRFQGQGSVSYVARIRKLSLAWGI